MTGFSAKSEKKPHKKRAIPGIPDNTSYHALHTRESRTKHQKKRPSSGIPDKASQEATHPRKSREKNLTRSDPSEEIPDKTSQEATHPQKAGTKPHKMTHLLAVDCWLLFRQAVQRPPAGQKLLKATYYHPRLRYYQAQFYFKHHAENNPRNELLRSERVHKPVQSAPCWL